ncbi:MAG: hypothetical protein ACR2K4_03935 [Candidatus Limnocylindria bacterium]
MARPRSDWPDGIKHDHARPVAGWRRHASPLALVVFGAVIALGLLGVLGHERFIQRGDDPPPNPASQDEDGPA